jgi:hypothetical protein
VAPETDTKPDTNPAGHRKPAVIEWLQTVPGIVTAVAGLLAALGAFYGGAQLSSANGAPQPAVTVTVPGPGPTVTVPAVAAPSSPPAGSVPAATGTSLPPGAVSLSTLTPLQDVEPGTSGETASPAPQRVGTAKYSDSIRFNCGDQGYQSSLVYEVSGYSTLRLTLGVPNDAADAVGNSATVQFSKDGNSQLIPQVTAALDHAQAITVPLAGTSQLEISCTAASYAGAGGIDIVLGNATLLR